MQSARYFPPLFRIFLYESTTKYESNSVSFLSLLAFADISRFDVVYMGGTSLNKTNKSDEFRSLPCRLMEGQQTCHVALEDKLPNMPSVAEYKMGLYK